MFVDVCILSNKCDCEKTGGLKRKKKLIYLGSHGDWFISEINRFIVDEQHRYTIDHRFRVRCTRRRATRNRNSYHGELPSTNACTRGARRSNVGACYRRAVGETSDDSGSSGAETCGEATEAVEGIEQPNSYSSDAPRPRANSCDRHYICDDACANVISGKTNMLLLAPFEDEDCGQTIVAPTRQTLRPQARPRTFRDNTSNKDSKFVTVAKRHETHTWLELCQIFEEFINFPLHATPSCNSCRGCAEWIRLVLLSAEETQLMLTMLYNCEADEHFCSMSRAAYLRDDACVNSDGDKRIQCNKRDNQRCRGAYVCGFRSKNPLNEKCDASVMPAVQVSRPTSTTNPRTAITPKTQTPNTSTTPKTLTMPNTSTLKQMSTSSLPSSWMYESNDAAAVIKASLMDLDQIRESLQMR